MENNTNALAHLAATMNITAAQAIVLPTAITVAARITEQTESDLIKQTFTNKPLRNYIRSIVVKTAKKELV